MIDLLLGLGLIPLLILVNYIVIALCKLFPEKILAITPVMIGLDLIVTLGYAISAKMFAAEVKLLLGGIGISIVVALAHKVLTMISVFRKMFDIK